MEIVFSFWKKEDIRVLQLLAILGLQLQCQEKDHQGVESEDECSLVVDLMNRSIRGGPRQMILVHDTAILEKLTIVIVPIAAESDCGGS